MTKRLGKIGLFGKSGKRAGEHDDEDEEAKAKAAEEEEEEEAKAKAAEEEEEEEETKAKAAEEEDEEEEAAKSTKAVARAAKAARLNARAITDLCALAGKPELAGEFIAAGVSHAAVRKELLGARAETSAAGEIAGQTGPNDSPGAVAAMWDHAIEKNTRAGTAGVNRKVA